MEDMLGVVMLISRAAYDESLNNIIVMWRWYTMPRHQKIDLSPSNLIMKYPVLIHERCYLLFKAIRSISLLYIYIYIYMLE